MATTDKTNPSGNSNQDLSEELEIKRYFGLFLSNWYWFVVSLFVAVVISYGFNTYSERLYTVSASMLIQDDKTYDKPGIESIMPGGDIFRSRQTLNNEIGILKSYKLNLRVMEELKDFHVTYFGYGRRKVAEWRLYNKAPFIIEYNPDSLWLYGRKINIRVDKGSVFNVAVEGENGNETLVQPGGRFRYGTQTFVINNRFPGKEIYDPSGSNNYAIMFESPYSLAMHYKNKLSIAPIQEDATVVALTVNGPVPAQEAAYLNKLMEVYINEGLEVKNRTADSTIKFINKQLGIILDSLNNAEENLTVFRRQNKLVNLSAEGNATLLKLENLENEKVRYKLQQSYYEYLLNYVSTRSETGNIISPAVMGIDNILLAGLVEELGKAQQEKKQLSYNFSSDLPAVQVSGARITELMGAITENAHSGLDLAERNLGSVDERLSSAEKELQKIPFLERQYLNLQRTFDLNNTVYTYMLEKRSEASIAKASNVSGNRVVDEAYSFNSGMIKPRARRNYMFAIIFGIFLPGIYIFFIDQMHNKIIDRKDIERGTSVPIIGFIGHNSSNNELPVLTQPGSSLSESFRSIRTSLKYYTQGKQKGVLLVTSTLSGEGKTFFSTNLASAFAILGKKTLLIGLDLRKPRIQKIFDNRDKTGITNYLIGDADFDETIGATSDPNLFIARSGPVPPNPAELIESVRMKEYMDTAKERFDYIILDTPPVGIVSDALLLAGYSDLNIFVIRQHFTYKNTLEMIQGFSEKNILNNLTLVVNDINISGYYGYGLRYGYGFYEGYGYSYGYGSYGTGRYGEYNKYYSEEE